MVRQPSPFSDHSQLVGWIKISNPPINPSLVNQQELFSLPRQFKWSQDSRDKFITALQSSEAKQIISNFENLNPELLGDVNVAVAEFVKIFGVSGEEFLTAGQCEKEKDKVTTNLV